MYIYILYIYINDYAIPIPKLSIFPDCHYFSIITLPRLSLFITFHTRSLFLNCPFPDCRYFETITYPRLSLKFSYFPCCFFSQIVTGTIYKNFLILDCHFNVFLFPGCNHLEMISFPSSLTIL